MNRISVKVKYKFGGGEISFDSFEQALQQDYLIHIRPDSRPQADGAFDSIVDIFLNITFEDFFKIVRDGIIWDVVTRGKESFILKPIIKEFQELEKINTCWDYSCVRINFDDTEVLLYGIRNMFTSNVGTTMTAIAKHYSRLMDGELGSPYQIIVPLTKDIQDDQEVYINWGSGDGYELKSYTEYWGIAYRFGYIRKVYDVVNQTILDTEWRK